MDQAKGTTVPKSAHKYCKWLDKKEPELKQSIQRMMNELQRHFKINPESSV